MKVLLIWVTAEGEELFAYMLFTAAFILLIRTLATQDFYSMLTKMLDEFRTMNFTLIG